MKEILEGIWEASASAVLETGKGFASAILIGWLVAIIIAAVISYLVFKKNF